MSDLFVLLVKKMLIYSSKLRFFCLRKPRSRTFWIKHLLYIQTLVSVYKVSLLMEYYRSVIKIYVIICREMKFCLGLAKKIFDLACRNATKRKRNRKNLFLNR
jgi:hypothetical protein